MFKGLMSILATVALIVTLTVVTGCTKQEKTVGGVLIGAGTGAAIGGVAGGGTGAAVGGVAGGLVGGIIGNSMGGDK